MLYCCRPRQSSFWLVLGGMWERSHLWGTEYFVQHSSPLTLVNNISWVKRVVLWWINMWCVYATRESNWGYWDKPRKSSHGISGQKLRCTTVIMAECGFRKDTFWGENPEPLRGATRTLKQVSDQDTQKLIPHPSVSLQLSPLSTTTPTTIAFLLSKKIRKCSSARPRE